jgi:hypothetical protein
MLSLDEKPQDSDVNPQNLPDTRLNIFAHRTEETFARLLDYYGIQWEYEPHSFPLAWDDRGQIIEAFTPDFFLPQQNLYIELTTLKPRLTTKKNRKLRQLRKHYPEINIKLFKRSDLRQMMVKYGMDKDAERIMDSNAQE